MNQGWRYSDHIDVQSSGLSVLEYYTQRYRHSSEAQWRARIESGQVLLEGQAAAIDTRLQPGQHLVYHRPPWQEPNAPLDFEVLYEDSDLLVVVKPSGLPVLPGGGFLEHTLLHLLRHRYPQNPPIPIHRLGRGTSGLMVLARSSLAKSGLSQQFRDSTLDLRCDHQIGKVYRALVKGNEMPETFEVSAAIGKIAHPNLGYVYGVTPTGKSAVSECRVLQRRGDCALLDVKILTGRPHQIRIHLAAAGYPLLGDPLYGSGAPLTEAALLQAKIPVPGDCGYCLHAHRLSFIHPKTAQLTHWVAPPPAILCPSPTPHSDP